MYLFLIYLFIYYLFVCLFVYLFVVIEKSLYIKHFTRDRNCFSLPSIFQLVLRILQGYLTFSCYFIFDRILCFDDFLPMRTLCGAYQKELESRYRSILDIPAINIIAI